MSKASEDPKKKKLPKDITERPDDEVIERLFGKKVLRELKKVAGKDAPEPEPDRPQD